MTEATVQAAVQTIIQAMSEFASADVVINDWDVLDDSGGAPFVIIGSSDTFSSRQDTSEARTVWQLPITLYELFQSSAWKTTLDNFTTRRDALLTKMNTTGTARSAGGATETTIDVIRSGGLIEPYFDPYTEIGPESIPIYIFQRLIAEVEEY